MWKEKDCTVPTLPQIQTKEIRKIDTEEKIQRKVDIVINKEERERRMQKRNEKKTVL